MTSKTGKQKIITVVSLGLFSVLTIFSLSSSVLLSRKETSYNTQAASNDCRDNPETAPGGYYWKADCYRACQSNNDCPKNFDQSEVNSESSNWCYGFTVGSGGADPKCLMLQYIGGGGAPANSPLPTQSNPPPNTPTATMPTFTPFPTSTPRPIVTQIYPTSSIQIPTSINLPLSSTPVVTQAQESSKLLNMYIYMQNLSTSKILRPLGLYLNGKNYPTSSLLIPGEIFSLDYRNECGWFIRSVNGYILYSSSEDSYSTIRSKQISLDCGKAEVIAIE